MKNWVIFWTRNFNWYLYSSRSASGLVCYENSLDSCWTYWNYWWIFPWLSSFRNPASYSQAEFTLADDFLLNFLRSVRRLFVVQILEASCSYLYLPYWFIFIHEGMELLPRWLSKRSRNHVKLEQGPASSHDEHILDLPLLVCSRLFNRHLLLITQQRRTRNA